THRTTACATCQETARQLNAASDKWLADQGAGAPPVQLMFDEAHVRELSDALDACERTCHETHSATTTRHPKSRGVSEDNPLYMENYKAQGKPKTSTHKKTGDDGSGPSREDVERQNDEPAKNDSNPEPPIPH